jgi:nicotinate-nucleotide adenylyltransferase
MAAEAPTVRLGVFGGTFDPPHLAHTMACLWALESGEVDRIVVVPVAHHAFGKEPAADFAHRMAMCRLAMARLGEAVEVSDLEARRPGPSYMIDTLAVLAARHPGAAMRLLVGSDVIRQLPLWHRASEVMRLAPPLEIPRPAPGESLDNRPGTLPAISSTAVRNSLRRNAGPPPIPLVSRDVLSYIKQYNLYQEPNRP